jgi:hypothetical protein
MNYKTFRRKAGIVLSSAFAMSENMRSGYSSLSILSIGFDSPQFRHFNILPVREKVLFQQQSFISNTDHRFKMPGANNTLAHL